MPARMSASSQPKIDPAKVAEARGMVPALKHDREFSLPPDPALKIAGE